MNYVRQEAYILGVGNNGYKRLEILNQLVNDFSQTFLRKLGIKSGMTVLDLGCGLGQMSIWFSKQLLPGGKVLAIDNSEEQISIAKEKAKHEGIENIKFIIISAYNLDSLQLNGQIDLIFSRFVLSHLANNIEMLENLKQLLKMDGILVVQEGIASHIFSYPENNTIKKWLALCEKISINPLENQDLGIRLLSLFHDISLDIVDYEYHNPVLKTEYEKLQLARHVIEVKEKIITFHIITEEEIDKIIDEFTMMAKDSKLLVNYCPSIIIAGKKTLLNKPIELSDTFIKNDLSTNKDELELSSSFSLSCNLRPVPR